MCISNTQYYTQAQEQNKNHLKHENERCKIKKQSKSSNTLLAALYDVIRAEPMHNITHLTRYTFEKRRKQPKIIEINVKKSIRDSNLSFFRLVKNANLKIPCLILKKKFMLVTKNSIKYKHERLANYAFIKGVS